VKSTSITTFTERVHELNQEYQLLYQRSLVDLALSDRHAYWDVETLEEAIQDKGFPSIIRELQQAPKTLSTRVLIQAIHQVALQIQEWPEQSVQYRFLTLWREKCQDFGWEEMARQCEGLMFDYRLSSIQRKVTLEEYPKQRVDASRIGMMSTANGQWLLDVSREGIRSWDSNTGQEGPFWSVDSIIDLVSVESDAHVLIATRDGGLYRWDVLFQMHQELFRLEDQGTFEALCYREGKIVAWANQVLYVLEDTGEVKLQFQARFRSRPTVALSTDGQRVLACDGATLGVWSSITGGVIFGLGFHSSLSADDINRVESIVSLGRTAYGLRLMDKLELWGLKLSRQYQTIQGLSDPFLMSGNDDYVVMGEDDLIALLEWDTHLEEYVVISEMQIEDVWSFQQVYQIAPNCRTIVALGTNGLVALDFQRQKEARYPLSLPLATKLCVLPDSGLIACDDTQRISFFIFRAD